MIANTKKCVQRHPQRCTDTSCGIKGRGFGRMGEEIINGGEGDAGSIGNVLTVMLRAALFSRHKSWIVKKSASYIKFVRYGQR